eukprot:TRINITY_DN8483_c0_g1_i1.p1 TRINITY_DN8483_c0_g1~~TRINITY_DN8483_c0_g1_i1.p1  ORF type:complete len:338 (-),score=28.08 TRINITY_DN8483_c0_g1_i1:23-1036(-)
METKSHLDFQQKKRLQELVYNLPPEAWLVVFSFLDNLTNILSARRVSKSWQELIDRTVKCINLSYNSGVTNQFLQNLLNSSVFKNMRALNLAGCDKITDSGLENLDKFENLETLDLSYCKKITDNGFSKIGHLRNLRKLELYECQISDTGAASFLEFTNLTKLMLHGCMRLQTLGFLSKLSNLRWLSLVNCYFITDKECMKINMMNLEHLNLSGCRITDSTLDFISNSSKRLRYLNFSSCAHITDTGINLLSNISTLTSLHLSGLCKYVTDNGLKSIACIKSLVCFAIPWSETITDEGVNYLAQLPELQQLDLFMCSKVTPNVLKTLPKHVKVSMST